MSNYTEDCLNYSQYYDKIQATMMQDKYVGVPSIMTIIDLDFPSIMTYSEGKN